jgi:hypothetical protein
MSSATDGLSPCAVRQAEMEFRMYDIWPATRPGCWMRHSGEHLRRHHCLKSLVMNSTAATVSGELITTFSFAS